MKSFSLIKPETFSKEIIKGKVYYRYCFDITPENEGYSFREVFLLKSLYTYDNIVSVIITSEYSESQMTAIINNFLLDSSNREEFDKMQNFRKFAKNTAKEILTYIEAL